MQADIHIYIYKFIYYTKNLVLVFWPEDDAVSIVSKNAVINPVECCLKEGVDCQVKERKKVYKGRIIAIGK